MRILTNDNNEYFGLVSDYKNLEVFRNAVIEESMYSDRVIVRKIIEMRPLTDHELSEEGDYSTYEHGHWIPVDVPCETSCAFYLATQGITTDKPSAEEVVVEIEAPLNQNEQIVKNVINEEDVPPYVEGTGHFEFHDNDGTEDEFSTEYSQERTEEINEEE